jgi:hypothetical protein
MERGCVGDQPQHIQRAAADAPQNSKSSHCRTTVVIATGPRLNKDVALNA